METKYGNATINGKGHLRITSKKEGYHGKLLHRLIWEDFYGKSIPDTCVIHHLNGNKTDNRIQNLQCCDKRKHMSLHMKQITPINKGTSFSEQHKINLSKSTNTSGYFRVSKMGCKECKQGFRWRYMYYENGKHKKITSVSLEKLEEKVKAKGLEWFKFEDMEESYDKICM